MMLCTQFEVYETPRGSGELIYVQDAGLTCGNKMPDNQRYIGRINTQDLMRKEAQRMLRELNIREKRQDDIDTMVESC